MKRQRIKKLALSCFKVEFFSGITASPTWSRTWAALRTASSTEAQALSPSPWYFLHHVTPSPSPPSPPPPLFSWRENPLFFPFHSAGGVGTFEHQQRGVGQSRLCIWPLRRSSPGCHSYIQLKDRTRGPQHTPSRFEVITDPPQETGYWILI